MSIWNCCLKMLVMVFRHQSWNRNVNILTKLSSLLCWKLRKWQLPARPIMKISSKWHFRFNECINTCQLHYSGVIMSTMASQINSVSIVWLTVCSGMNQRKYQSPSSLAFVRGMHRWIRLTKGQWRGKCFHLMTSSCCLPAHWTTE